MNFTIYVPLNPLGGPSWGPPGTHIVIVVSLVQSTVFKQHTYNASSYEAETTYYLGHIPLFWRFGAPEGAH